MLDIEKLRRLVRWAEMSEEWDQTTWAAVPAAELVERVEVPEPVVDDWGWVDHTVEVPAGVAVDCGASFCLAGHLCAEAGDAFLVDSSLLDEDLIDGVVEVDSVRTADGREMGIAARAAELLGVTSSDLRAHDGVRGHLFDGDLTLEDVKRIAAVVAERKGLTL